MTQLAEPGRHYVTPLGRVAVALPKPVTGRRAHEDAYPFEYVHKTGRATDDGFWLRWVNVAMLEPAHSADVAAAVLARFGVSA